MYTRHRPVPGDVPAGDGRRLSPAGGGGGVQQKLHSCPNSSVRSVCARCAWYAWYSLNALGVALGVRSVRLLFAACARCGARRALGGARRPLGGARCTLGRGRVTQDALDWTWLTYYCDIQSTLDWIGITDCQGTVDWAALAVYCNEVRSVLDRTGFTD